MKVLQINCVYDEGSTGKITRDIHLGLLEKGVESRVLCGRRAKGQKGVVGIVPEWYAKGQNLLSRISGVPYGGCLLSTEKIKAIIRKETPDIVHLQCINGHFCNIFRLLAFLKKSGVKTVLTLHAEFMYTANCSHAGLCEKWKKGCHRCEEFRSKTHSYFVDRTASSYQRMHRIYRDWDDLFVVAPSRWTASRAGESGEMAKRDITVIPNGIDNTNVFYPREGAKENLIKRYALPEDKKYILYVSPGFSHLKGFDLFTDLVKKCENLPFHFLLVGGEYQADAKNLTVIGKVNDPDLLAELYSGSDCLVTTSRNETYPTVSLEAQSCGTKVVGFDVGGVMETILDGMGKVVPAFDLDLMARALKEVSDEKPSRERVEMAREYHSKEQMVEKYFCLYKKILPL